MFFTPLQRAAASLHRLRSRLGLSVSGVFALFAGLATLAATTIAFGGVTEDVTRHNGLSTTDSSHLRWFVQHRPTALVSFSRLLTEIGSPVVLVLLAMLVTTLLWLRGQRLAIALSPGLALVVGGACAAVGKSIVERARPPVGLHLVAESDASFPSGHATDSTALFVTLAFVVALYVLRRPIARALAVVGGALLSGAIGASRLVLGVHWPTDVVAGWALGLLAALVVTIAASLIVSITGNGSISPDRRPRLARLAHLVTLRRSAGEMRAA